MDLTGAQLTYGEAVAIVVILEDTRVSFIPDDVGAPYDRYAVLAGPQQANYVLDWTSLYQNSQGRWFKAKFHCYNRMGVDKPIPFSLGMVVKSADGLFETPIFYDPKVKNDGVAGMIGSGGGRAPSRARAKAAAAT
jgi:hypothetical protein